MGGNKGYFKDSTAREQIAALTNIVNYTVSDITELHQSMTINELSVRKCGKIVTLGLNFNATASISQFTNLFKLPSSIASFARLDAVGIFCNFYTKYCAFDCFRRWLRCCKLHNSSSFILSWRDSIYMQIVCRYTYHNIIQRKVNFK